MNPYEPLFFAKCLGGYVVVKGLVNSNNAQIRLFFESGVDKGAYYPPQDICIYGERQIQDLKDFCEEILKCRKQYKQELKATL